MTLENPEASQRTGLTASFAHAAARLAMVPPWQFIGAFTVFCVLLGVLVVITSLPDSLLYVGVIPVTLAALYQRRRITYLASALLLAAAGFVTVWYVSPDVSASTKTILLSLGTMLVLCELVYTLSRIRRQAQRAERESAVLLETTLNAIPDLIGIQGPNHEIYAYNEAGYRFLNKRPEEVIGRKCHELIGRETPCDICATREVYETRKPAQTERYEPALDVWLDVRAYPILDEQGNILRVIEHLRDITERKKNEKALQESRQFLQDIFDAIQDGICVLDKDLTILRVNRWVEQRFRKDLPLTGKKCYQVYRCRSEPCPSCPAAQTIASGGTHSKTIQEGAGEGTGGWLELSTFPLKDSEGRVIGVIEYLKDINQRMEAETEKEKLHQRLLQSQKMEAIGRLAGGISHDFNNVLTAIHGYTGFLLEAFADDDPKQWPPAPEVRVNLNEIVTAARRAQSLTAQLLAFSRKQIVKPQVISIAETLSNIEPMLRRLIGEDIELIMVISTGESHVLADPSQIEQVVLNLAVNARDAMPSGGELFFEVSASRSGTSSEGHHVHLKVRDTGAGMSEEVKAHLFEPFFTTKDVGKGTGLGLSTVYAIVDQLGGQIRVESEEGAGAIFHIDLPGIAAPQPSAHDSAPQRGMPGGTETILLAEDEKMVRELISVILNRCGYTVLAAERPTRALEIAGENQHGIDLLISDVVMPEMGGTELAERLTRLHPALRVLFISGYTGETIDHEGLLDPEVDLIQKPFSAARLAVKVREILDRED